MKLLIRKILKETLNEAYEEAFAKEIPNIEKKLNIEVLKTLGESMGIAYLTTDGRVLKLTSSEDEANISLGLLDNPSKYYPKIYEIDTLNKNWYIILKEYIPEIDAKTKKLFTEFEEVLNDWTEDDTNQRLMSEKLKETKGTLFKDYLLDDKPYMVNMYEDLMGMMEDGLPLNKQGILDIHVDNLGYRDKNLVLYDY